MENEMLALPLVWGIIALTAVLSAVVTTSLPYMGGLWNAFITRIKRLFTREKGDIVDIIILSKLQEELDEMEKRVEQLEKRVELHTRKDKVYLDKFDEMEALFAKRENDRKSKVKKQVIEYLNELKNG